MKPHFFSGMSNIVTLPTNISQPLKKFKSLAVSRSVPLSRDNTCGVSFQKHRPQHRIANGRYFDDLPKIVHFDQFKKYF